jgi:all-trans-retinol dehydrogenase (NAD+)
LTQIRGNNVLITGGASGIGRILALKMVAEGAKVVIWDVDTARLASVVEELNRDDATRGFGYVCDVSDRESVYATAAKVRRDVGVINILINNAGKVSGSPLLQCSDESVERTMAVNTLAMFWTCKAFLPDMVQQDMGHIVTMASAAGIIGVNRLVDYCASKWAAVGFDESLRMELHELAPNVKTTIVCPFYVDTGLFAGVATRFPRLLPILQEEYVAQRIVAAVARNRPRLMMPSMVYFVPLLRILPVRLFDSLANFLGINRSMEHFVGRGGAGESTSEKAANGVKKP